MQCNYHFLHFFLGNYWNRNVQMYNVFQGKCIAIIHMSLTFNPPNGLNTRDEIKTRSRVNFRVNTGT